MPSSLDLAGKSRGFSCWVQNWLAKENWETASLKKRGGGAVEGAEFGLGAGAEFGLGLDAEFGLGLVAEGLLGSRLSGAAARAKEDKEEARPRPAAPRAAWRRKFRLFCFIL